MASLLTASPSAIPHVVAVLALDGVVAWDLSIPCLIFGHVRRPDGSPAYDVRICGPDPQINTDAFGVQVPYTLDETTIADTVVVPGFTDPASAASPQVIAALRAGWDRGARIASICSGAFVLAETGLLNNRRATTHWIGTREFAERFPAVHLDPDVLFVDEGRIITSAGASAGLDMCLHLVRRDHGQAVAATAARFAVTPIDREGGQAQFIRHELAGSNASLAPVLDWMLRHLDQHIDISRMARQAGMTPRTFARRFREQIGTTPLQWLLLARVRRAQELLEQDKQSVDAIASAVGFHSPVTFRSRFRRIVGVPPANYRRKFGMRDASSAFL